MSDVAGSRLGLGFSWYSIRSSTVHKNLVNGMVGFPVRFFIFRRTFNSQLAGTPIILKVLEDFGGYYYTELFEELLVVTITEKTIATIVLTDRWMLLLEFMPLIKRKIDAFHVQIILLKSIFTVSSKL